MRRHVRTVLLWSLALILWNMAAYALAGRRKADDKDRLVLSARLLDQAAVVASAPPGPLPDECQPYKPHPVPERVDPAKLKHPPGADPKGLECWSDGYCDYNAVTNASRYAGDYLWTKSESGTRAPYGSFVGCEEPMTAETVRCHVDVNDAAFNQVMEISLACRGHVICERSAECCKETGRQMKFVPFKALTGEEAARWEADRRASLKSRADKCRPYCTHPAYMARCSNCWDQ